MDLLRFATAGSVDDGKSTLIGRLLYDSQLIFEDTLAAIAKFGLSDRIDYNGQADVVRFEQRATLRRYRGAVLTDETSGSLIVYNNASETFSVDGGEASKTPANPSGRVRAMLTPTPKPADGAATPAPPDAVRLRAAPALDGVGR